MKRATIFGNAAHVISRVAGMRLPLFGPPALLPTPVPRCGGCHAGVPGLPTWLSRRFPEAESRSVGSDVVVDSLAFDLNSVVHSKLRIARDEDHAIALILKHLHAVQRTAAPSRHVLLALDGAAPYAKTKTQRKRRLKSQQRELRKADSRGKRPPRLSSLLATPGTAFMAKIEAALLYWCSSEALRGRRQYLLSGSDTPGEGELKILSWLLCRSCDGPASERVRSAMIVGSDGDLLIHSLVLQEAFQRFALRGGQQFTPRAAGASAWQQKNARGNALRPSRRSLQLDLWVMRELPKEERGGAGGATEGRGGAGGGRTRAEAESDEPLAIVSITQLGAALDAEAAAAPLSMAGGAAAVGQSRGSEDENENAAAASSAPGAGLDLVILTSLLGNDYLPKIKSTSAELVWSGYCALRTTEPFRDRTMVCSSRRSVDARCHLCMRYSIVTNSRGCKSDSIWSMYRYR